MSDMKSVLDQLVADQREEMKRFSDDFNHQQTKNRQQISDAVSGVFGKKGPPPSEEMQELMAILSANPLLVPAVLKQAKDLQQEVTDSINAVLNPA